jgi:hypothetical protein
VDVNRGIIVVSLGDRGTLLKPLMSNLRHYTNLPIVLYTDCEHQGLPGIEQILILRSALKWLDNPRWGIRNTNVISARAILNGPFDSCCVLNDDMRIVDKNFHDGFTLAERFGVCVPLNPRVYVGINARGADAEDTDYNPTLHGPERAPACNVSPLFACRRLVSAQTLLTAYLQELESCMRGTLAFWKASWRTGITPVYLPEQWCVCESNAIYLRDLRKFIRGRVTQVTCMILHWGQAGVREAFKGYYNGLD